MMKRIWRLSCLWLHNVRGTPNYFQPHGVSVYIPPDTNLALRYKLARGRPYEAPEAEMIKSYLALDTNVIELGGCFGVISALIRSRIGVKAHHIIVEANPGLGKVLLHNAVQGAEPGRTEIVQAAVDYSGAAHVHFKLGHNEHVGHVSREGEDGFTVPAITLSQLSKRLPSGSFALICDIEGGELALFEAEHKNLENINLLVLETHPHVYPNGLVDLQEMIARITDAGLREVSRSDQVICFQRTIN